MTSHIPMNPLRVTAKFTVNVLASAGLVLGAVLLLAIANPQFEGHVEDYAAYYLLKER